MNIKIAEGIKNVIDTGENFNLPYMLPISEISDFLKNECGFDKLEMDGEETNGWQIDFWYTFIHPEKGKYCLSGSLHYGEFVFSKK